jgi:hypothetical protein
VEHSECPFFTSTPHWSRRRGQRYCRLRECAARRLLVAVPARDWFVKLMCVNGSYKSCHAGGQDCVVNKHFLLGVEVQRARWN